MASRIEEIEQLRLRLAELEAAAKREEELKGFMQECRNELAAKLEARESSFEEFVVANLAEIKKIVAKSERSGGRAAKGSKVSKVKIPAGDYTNIPPNLNDVFTVKEKGPRPKLVREHAEQLGLEAFLEQCARR